MTRQRAERTQVHGDGVRSASAAVAREPSPTSAPALSIFLDEGFGWQLLASVRTYDEARRFATPLRSAGGRVMIVIHSAALRHGSVILEKDVGPAFDSYRRALGRRFMSASPVRLHLRRSVP